jgi:hypothetical protein
MFWLYVGMVYAALLVAIVHFVHQATYGEPDE